MEPGMVVAEGGDGEAAAALESSLRVRLASRVSRLVLALLESAAPVAGATVGDSAAAHALSSAGGGSAIVWGDGRTEGRRKECCDCPVDKSAKHRARRTPVSLVLVPPDRACCRLLDADYTPPHPLHLPRHHQHHHGAERVQGTAAGAAGVGAGTSARACRVCTVGRQRRCGGRRQPAALHLLQGAHCAARRRRPAAGTHALCAQSAARRLGWWIAAAGCRVVGVGAWRKLAWGAVHKRLPEHGSNPLCVRVCPTPKAVLETVFAQCGQIARITEASQVPASAPAAFKVGCLLLSSSRNTPSTFSQPSETSPALHHRPVTRSGRCQQRMWSSPRPRACSGRLIWTAASPWQFLWRFHPAATASAVRFGRLRAGVEDRYWCLNVGRPPWSVCRA